MFIFTLVYGPIPMPEEMVALSSELRFLLWILTAGVLIIFVSGKTMGRGKAIFLLGFYFLFVLYVIGRGSDNAIAQSIADWLVSTVNLFTFH